MTPNEIQAARAMREVLNRSAMLAAQREGEECDAAFDGGEWSRAFHDRAHAEIVERLERVVGVRFGMSGEQVRMALQCWCYETEGRMIEAAQSRRGELLYRRSVSLAAVHAAAWKAEERRLRGTAVVTPTGTRWVRP